MSLVALIALITLVVRSRRRGASWPMAMITGAKRYLQGLLAIYGLLLVLVVGIAITRAILYPVADTANDLFPDGQPAASQAGRVPELPATEMPVVATLTPPTSTPRAVVAPTPKPRVMIMPTSLAGEIVESPQRTPPPAPTSTPTPATPTPPNTLPATPANERTGCDPAYPDAGTCIPPGPPFDQGCAITEERGFAVLPPEWPLRSDDGL